jgi:arginase
MGVQDIGVGRGPTRLVVGGAANELGSTHGPASVTHIRKRDTTAENWDGVVDLNRQVAASVWQTLEEGRLPFVLSGNCNSCLGTLAGMRRHFDGKGGLGIVWLDAHPDFHSFETSTSGSLDGMALAVCVGEALEEFAGRNGLWEPVPSHDVVLAGVRSLDEGEGERLERSQVQTFPAWVLESEAGAADFERALSSLASRVEAIYLHIDLDVVSPEDSPGVSSRPPGGISAADLTAIIQTICMTAPVKAAALTNYYPDLDENHKSLRTAFNLLRAVAGSYKLWG